MEAQNLCLRSLKRFGPFTVPHSAQEVAEIPPLLAD
jgi:hypothetical protein